MTKTLKESGLPPPSTGELPRASPEAIDAIAKRPHMLSSEELAALAGVRPEIVHEWHVCQRIVGVEDSSDHLRFPAWQIRDGRPIEGISDILEAMHLDHWAALRLLEEEIPELGGVTGMEAILSGRLNDLFRVIGARDLGSFS